MTKEEFVSMVNRGGKDLFICIAEVDNGFGRAVKGNPRDIIAHAIKLIVHAAEQERDEKIKIRYVRAAAKSLNLGAELMELNVKEKAPEAAATALSAGQ